METLVFRLREKMTDESRFFLLISVFDDGLLLFFLSYFQAVRLLHLHVISA